MLFVPTLCTYLSTLTYVEKIGILFLGRKVQEKHSVLSESAYSYVKSRAALFNLAGKKHLVRRGEEGWGEILWIITFASLRLNLTSFLGN